MDQQGWYDCKNLIHVLLRSRTGSRIKNLRHTVVECDLMYANESCFPGLYCVMTNEGIKPVIIIGINERRLIISDLKGYMCGCLILYKQPGIGKLKQIFSYGNYACNVPTKNDCVNMYNMSIEVLPNKIINIGKKNKIIIGSLDFRKHHKYDLLTELLNYQCESFSDLFKRVDKFDNLINANELNKISYLVRDNAIDEYKFEMEVRNLKRNYRMKTTDGGFINVVEGNRMTINADHIVERAKLEHWFKQIMKLNSLGRGIAINERGKNSIDMIIFVIDNEIVMTDDFNLKSTLIFHKIIERTNKLTVIDDVDISTNAVWHFDERGVFTFDNYIFVISNLTIYKWDLTGGNNDNDDYMTTQGVRNWQNLEPSGRKPYKFTSRALMALNKINDKVPTEQTLKKTMAIEGLIDFCYAITSSGSYNDEMRIELDLMNTVHLFTNQTIEGFGGNSKSVGIPVQDLYVEAMNYWDTIDQTNDIVRYAPMNDVKKLRSLKVASKTEIKIKTTMVEYPERSRDIQTKQAGQEFNAVTGRLGSVIRIQKKDYDPVSTALEVMNVFGKSDWREISKSYQADLLLPKSENIAKWLTGRPGCESIIDEFEQIMSEGFLLHPLNSAKVFTKLESLLKDDPTELKDETQTRIIVFQLKGICAIFSDVFMQAKKRFKAIMGEQFIYTDGTTPFQLSDRVKVIDLTDCNDLTFYENDLTKQDRQTNHNTINYEMEMYKLLGVHPGLIKLWRTTHDHWRAKGLTVSAMFDAMRWTGQATTALGNVMTNCLVHHKFLKANLSILKLWLMLGDDGLGIFSKSPDSSKLRSTIATLYNMQSKESRNSFVGTFCSMLCYKNNDNQLEIGPDIRRLRLRYEVPNGVHETNNENFIARKMSYAYMFGKNIYTDLLIKKYSWDFDIPAWYDVESCKLASSVKYGLNLTMIDNDFDLLGRSMLLDNVFSKENLIFTEQ
jgi:hypothetical protein